MASCASCTECNYVSVVAVTLNTDDKGVDRKTERRIVPPVRVSGVSALEFKGTRPWAAAGLQPKPEESARRETRPRAREEESEGRRRRRRERAPEPDEQSYAQSDAIVLRCPHCGKKSRLAPKYAGKRGRCPKCKGEVKVPKA
jgi:hypothetical protein